MMKKMLLCFGLMGLVSGNVHAMSNGSGTNPSGIFEILCKGIAGLAGAGFAYERLKNSYDDFVYGSPQPATFNEDLKNVGASILCAAAFMYAGGGNARQIASVAGSGVVIGGAFLGLKQCRGAKELRLREFVPAVAACGLGREALVAMGLPVLSFAAKID